MASFLLAQYAETQQDNGSKERQAHMCCLLENCSQGIPQLSILSKSEFSIKQKDYAHPNNNICANYKRGGLGVAGGVKIYRLICCKLILTLKVITGTQHYGTLNCFMQSLKKTQQ